MRSHQRDFLPRAPRTEGNEEAGGGLTVWVSSAPVTLQNPGTLC